MLSFRLIGTPGFRLFAIFWVWVLFLPPAHAQTGAFFERDKLSEKQYSLTIDSIFSALNRTDFSSPTFLLGEDLQELELLSFTTEIKAQIDLFEGIAIQVEAPLIVREVNAVHTGLAVSQSQVLDSQSRSYSSLGFGDPRLTLSIEVIHLFGMDYFLDIGTRMPLDDSPEGQPVPSQVPLSTGQNELFIGGGFNAQFGSVQASLSYRHSYFPGNTTAYLVRRASSGSWASGSTTAFIRESVSLALKAPVSDWGDLRVAPTWSLSAIPGVTDRGRSLGISAQSYIQEVTVEIGFDVKLGRHHILRPYFAGALLDSWNEDPFYPIEAPSRGFGLAWQYTSF